MNIPMFYEKRKSQRKRLTGLLPGKLTFAGQEQNIAFKPVDVSVDGIGIITNLAIKAGTKMELHMKDQCIEFEVGWGKPDFGKRDLFRYGLKCLNSETNIETLFLDKGCLE